MEIISQLTLRGLSVENNHEDSTEFLEIKETFILKETLRSEPLRTQTVALSEDSILEFQFDDDSVWISDPASMNELFPDALAKLRGIDSATLELPSSLSSPASERGLKDIALKVLKIFIRKKIVEPKVHELACKLEDKLLRDDRGLLYIDKNFNFVRRDIKDDTLHLLLIHGTASSTYQSFGALHFESEENPVETAVWKYIFTQYQGNILAFQHESLTKSPLDNVLELVKQLPQNAALHLLTQSRGGIVGELLSKFLDERANKKGFSDAEKAYLRKQGRAEDVDRIGEIEATIAGKNLRVDKFIRVACPANGTTLASKRLDVWLNIIFNITGLALGQATNPIFVAFKNLLTAVVETKDNPDVLPGLAPQNPESPINKVINNVDPTALLSSPLLIVSGDNEFSFRLRGLLTIVSNIFFMAKNDFVVNTASMYQGARRVSGSAQFFLDTGPDVSHFNYFKNSTTRTAILRALQAVGNARVDGFSPVPESVFAEGRVRGINVDISFGKLTPKPVSGSRPIVVILPGIMGSNLEVDDRSVWVNFAAFVAGELTSLEHNAANNKKVKAPSLVGDSYTKLYNHLSSEYDVTVFPFDWRLPMQDNTALLNTEIQALLTKEQPIKLIGHSMGGVLVRDFMIDHPDTWNKLKETPSFSLLFLGSPLNGSFRIASVLFGRDSLIKKLGLIDIHHSKKELLSYFSQFPGILSLLPFTTDAANDFANSGTWTKMREAHGDDDWPIPENALLNDFKRYRDNNLSKSTMVDLTKAVYIAGLAQGRDGTVSGYRITPKSLFRRNETKLEFLATLEGDGSVTWESGIPKKLIETGNVYYSTVEHGELANDPSLFAAISDILKVGSTNKLSKSRPMVTRGIGTPTNFIAPESFDFDISKAGLQNSILGLRSPDTQLTAAEIPLVVSVVNGNLKYATYPLLIGHFENDGIISAEKAVDEHLGKELSRRLQLGLYPGAVGTSAYIPPSVDFNFKGVIILGLGKQGELNERTLITTIEQGIATYLVSLSTSEGSITQVTKSGISALLIGSGYGGIGIENSVRAILQGAQNANQKIHAAYSPKAVRIEELEFIELYQDRTLACLRAVKTLENAEGSGLSIKRSGIGFAEQMGRRVRIPIESTVEWWTRVTVRRYAEEDLVSPERRNGLLFAITTDAARVEERSVHTSGNEITKLLKAASTDGKWTPELAKSLFELLVPNDFKPLVKRLSNVLLQLDDFTASIPWELFQDTMLDGAPLSINSGIIRQFTTKNFRLIINSVNVNTAYVVADPDLSDSNIQLQAALNEGSKVSQLLVDKGFGVTPEVRSTSDRILTKLYSQNYKVLHFAGHGVFEYGEEKQTGMLIGKDVFLTPAHIDQMSSVPELVFVNCCFLGQTETRSEELTENRYGLAANLGTQLIQIGVKAVVVAGWAVNDDAALHFAESFYKALFEGKAFGEAVKKARKSVYDIYKNRSNTWGAYQCYGDPFYRLTAVDDDSKFEFDFEVTELAEMELTNLKNELDIGTDITKATLKLNAIILGIKKDNLESAKIVELLALIYTGLGMYGEAIDEFKRLSKILKANFSISALEQFANVQVKFAIQQLKLGKKTAGVAFEEISSALADIQTLIKFGETSERYNILGSTFKRLAILSQGQKKEKYFVQASEAYKKAVDLSPAKDRYYPLTNWIAIDYALLRPTGTQPNGSSRNLVKGWLKLLEEELAAKTSKLNDRKNFWDYVAEADVKFNIQLLKYSKEEYTKLGELYKKVWSFTGHQGNRLGTIEQVEILIDLYKYVQQGKIVKRMEHIIDVLEGRKAPDDTDD